MPRSGVLMVCLAILIAWSGAFAAGKQEAESVSSRKQHLKAMFDAAKRKDGRFVEDYSASHSQEIRKDRVLDFARALSLYMADPAEYEKTYVEVFPTDLDTINEVYTTIESGEYFPEAFTSFSLFWDIALTGNKEAIRKSFAAGAHSDAGIGEGFADTNWQLLEKYPERALDALAELTEKDRKVTYESFLTVTDAEGFAKLAQSLNQRKDEFSKGNQAVIAEMVAFEIVLKDIEKENEKEYEKTAEDKHR